MKIFKGFILFYLIVVLATLFCLLYHMLAIRDTMDFAMLYYGAAHFFQGKSIYADVPWHLFHVPQVLQKDYIYFHPSIVGLGKDYSQNLNPPVTELFLLPFALMPYTWAAALWNFLVLLAGASGLWVVYRMYFKERANRWGFLTALGLFFASIPYYSNHTLSQLGTFIFLGVVYTWAWSRSGQDIKAGILLGVLLSVKYFLGLLAVFFLLQKRWRLILSSILSFLCLNLIARGVFGKTAYIQNNEILHYIVWYSNVWSASFYGYFGKLGADIVGDHYVMKPWAIIGYFVCAVAMILYQIKISLKKISTLREFDFAFSYALIACILVCPLGWIYYCGFFILPIFWVLEALSQEPKFFSYPFIFTFAFMLGMLSFPSKVMAFAHGSWRGIFFMYSPYFYGTLALLGLMFYVRNRWGNFVSKGINTSALMPWTVMAYLLITPAFAILFYGTFIEVPRVWV